MVKLIISAGNKKKLTSNQEAFNKVTAQIEKLRKEIAKKLLQYDSAIRMYSADILPLRLKKAAEMRKVFDILFGVYTSRRLSKPDQRVLKKKLQDDMYEIIQLLQDSPDDDLKSAFLELEGESYEHALKREDAQMKEELSEIFGQMDIDIDLSNVEDEKQLAEKLAEARQKIREQEQAQHQKRKYKKKTARQSEMEKVQQTREELKQKNISTIYRQLAKLFHPDLEQDENLKSEKEILMKQLTAAYQSKNLHELLLLELQWIHKESNHLETLTEEKLAVYLQVLREQVKDLEQEKANLFREPRYHVLHEEFGSEVFRAPMKMLEDEKTSLENDIRLWESNANIFQSDTSIKAIKKMLKEVKAEMLMLEEQDFINMLHHMDNMRRQK